MKINNPYQFVKVQKPLLHAKLNGFWDDDTAQEIGAEFIGKFQKAVDSMGNQKFIVIADLSTFKPTTEKVQQILAACMKYANENGLYKSIEIMPEAIQRLSVKSAVEKSGKSNFRVVVKSLAEAQSEYQKLKAQL